MENELLVAGKSMGLDVCIFSGSNFNLSAGHVLFSPVPQLLFVIQLGCCAPGNPSNLSQCSYLCLFVHSHDCWFDGKHPFFFCICLEPICKMDRGASLRGN